MCHFRFRCRVSPVKRCEIAIKLITETRARFEINSNCQANGSGAVLQLVRKEHIISLLFDIADLSSTSPPAFIFSTKNISLQFIFLRSQNTLPYGHIR